MLKQYTPEPVYKTNIFFTVLASSSFCEKEISSGNMDYEKLIRPRSTKMVLTKITWCYREYLDTKEKCFWFEFFK